MTAPLAVTSSSRLFTLFTVPSSPITPGDTEEAVEDAMEDAGQVESDNEAAVSEDEVAE